MLLLGKFADTNLIFKIHTQQQQIYIRTIIVHTYKPEQSPLTVLMPINLKRCNFTKEIACCYLIIDSPFCSVGNRNDILRNSTNMRKLQRKHESQLGQSLLQGRRSKRVRYRNYYWACKLYILNQMQLQTIWWFWKFSTNSN